MEERQIPYEIMLYIFSYLKDPDLLTVAQVSQDWHSIAGDQSLWKDRLSEISYYVPPVQDEVIDYKKAYLNILKLQKCDSCSLASAFKYNIYNLEQIILLTPSLTDKLSDQCLIDFAQRSLKNCKKIREQQYLFDRFTNTLDETSRTNMWHAVATTNNACNEYLYAEGIICERTYRMIHYTLSDLSPTLSDQNRNLFWSFQVKQRLVKETAIFTQYMEKNNLILSF